MKHFIRKATPWYVRLEYDASSVRNSKEQSANVHLLFGLKFIITFISMYLNILNPKQKKTIVNRR